MHWRNWLQNQFYRIHPKKYHLIANYFKSNYLDCALISYVAHPFRYPIKDNTFYTHSNIQEVLKIAELLHEKKYQVDIIDFNDPCVNPTQANKYQLLFGHQPNLDIFAEYNPKALIIPYTTGCSTHFQNRAELNRLDRLKMRRKVSLAPQLRATECKVMGKAAGIISIGTEYSRRTFPIKLQKKMRIITVSAPSFFPFSKIKSSKNFTEAKQHFLWFGGSGAVLKGLDLLLDTFGGLPKQHLHIAGPILREKNFAKAYRKELSLPNIHYHSWVDIDSKKFEHLVKQCAYVIFPSASESISGSVAISMQSGLIPIVSKAAGIDTSKSGITLASSKLSFIKNAVKECSGLPTARIRYLSSRAYQTASKNYSLRTFVSQFGQALDSILEAQQSKQISRVGILAEQLSWPGAVDIFHHYLSALKIYRPTIKLVLFVKRSDSSISQAKFTILQLANMLASGLRLPKIFQHVNDTSIIPRFRNLNTQIAYYRSDMERDQALKSVDVIFPVISPYEKELPIPWIGNIFDFQHYYYPNYFSKEERVARDIRFKDLL